MHTKRPKSVMNRFALANQNPAVVEIQKWQYSFLVCGRFTYPQAVLWICDILIRSGSDRICTLTYGSGFGSSIRILLYSTVAFKMPSGSVQNNDGSRWSKKQTDPDPTTLSVSILFLTDPDPQSWVVDLDTGGQLLLITDLNTTSVLPSRHYWCRI